MIFHKYPSINYWDQQKNLEDRYLNTPLHIQEKIDGSNIGISWHDNKINIQSRSMVTAHPKYIEAMEAFDWYQDLKNYLAYHRDHIIYGELCTPGKSPGRYAIHKEYTFHAFDLKYTVPDIFMKPRYAEKTFKEIDIPYLPILDTKTCTTLQDFKEYVQSLKLQAEKNKLEGYVLKSDTHSRCKIKHHRPIHMAKDRHLDEPLNLVPVLPDDEVYATIYKIYEDSPSEFADIKTAMPLIGRAVSAEARKHGKRPPKNLIAYYDTFRSEL